MHPTAPHYPRSLCLISVPAPCFEPTRSARRLASRAITSITWLSVPIAWPISPIRFTVPYTALTCASPTQPRICGSSEEALALIHGLALEPSHSVLFVTSYEEGLGRIDLNTGYICLVQESGFAPQRRNPVSPRCDLRRGRKRREPISTQCGNDRHSRHPGPHRQSPELQ